MGKGESVVKLSMREKKELDFRKIPLAAIGVEVEDLWGWCLEPWEEAGWGPV